MIVKLLTEHRLECLSLKGGGTGSSESTHVKMPYCWKSHALAHLLLTRFIKERKPLENCNHITEKQLLKSPLIIQSANFIIVAFELLSHSSFSWRARGNFHRWMGESFRNNPEFRILRLTFHRKSASKY